jgi:hypothetical protein
MAVRPMTDLERYECLVATGLADICPADPHYRPLRGDPRPSARHRRGVGRRAGAVPAGASPSLAAASRRRAVMPPDDEVLAGSTPVPFARGRPDLGVFCGRRCFDAPWVHTWPPLAAIGLDERTAQLLVAPALR